MTQFLGEFLGTFILVLLGDGVVAGNVLSKTKEEGTGWTAIVFGWGIACTVAVYVSGLFSPAHLNPAVTLAMASIGAISWGQYPLYHCTDVRSNGCGNYFMVTLLSSLERNKR